MAYRYGDREQTKMLPPSVKEYVPANALCSNKGLDGLIGATNSPSPLWGVQPGTSFTF